MIALVDDSAGGWSGVSRERWERLRPYVLDCADLSDSTCKLVREEFRQAGIAGLKALADRFGRVPTQDETDKLRAALAQYFNNHRIAEIAATRGE